MRLATIILSLAFLINCCSCTAADKEGSGLPNLPGGNGPEEPGQNDHDNMKLRLTIGSKAFTAKFANTRAAEAFKERLPLTLSMRDVNNNEKYASLNEGLPTSAVNPGTIHTGDLMLWGSAGIVLFYKTFTTTYGYTPIGKVDDPTGLEGEVGRGNVAITFELINDAE